jgi:single-strand DNA-binding protein
MAKDLNKVLASGRLGRDVELRITPNGKSVASFSVASSRSTSGNGKEETTWFRVTAWEKLAETCANYLKKGSHVIIEGREVDREYDDKSGQKRQSKEIQLQELYMLGSKGEHEHLGSATGDEGAGEELPDGIPF